VYVGKTYTQFATWAAHTIRCRWLMYGYSKRVRHLFEALATGTNHGHWRVKRGDVGGPWIRTRVGGVSRFLLPTFLCGGKEK